MSEVTPDAVDWSRVHADFPVNRQLVWLNNCGISPPPGPVIEATVAHLRAYAERGIFAARPEAVAHDALCGRLSRLLGVDPDELAIVHNTTEGMTFLSHGFSLSAGDRIALLDNEYPSNVYPWEHWRGHGVEIDFVPLGRSPDELLSNFAATLTPRTRVASVSAVHWCTGMPLPLRAIGRLCADRQIELVVDGAQGVGHVPLAPREMGIGYMAFSAWKWLLGPVGAGALYVRRDRLDRLRFPFKGTASVVDDETYLPYKTKLKPTAARFVVSTPSLNDWVHFDASLAYLERLGFAAVMARVHALSARLADGLRGAGFSLASDQFPGVSTAILSVHKPGHDPDALAAALRRAGVVTAVRLGRLRLAPHAYLSEAQIDDVVRQLAALTA